MNAPPKLAGRWISLLSEDELTAAEVAAEDRRTQARRDGNEAARRQADAMSELQDIAAERRRRWRERKAANR